MTAETGELYIESMATERFLVGKVHCYCYGVHQMFDGHEKILSLSFENTVHSIKFLISHYLKNYRELKKREISIEEYFVL